MKTKKKFFSKLALGILALQTVSTVVAPVKANAKSLDGTITWSNSNTSRISGTKGGQAFSDWVTPLYVNGKVAFCIEPGVIINSENESGYKGDPANGNLPRRAMLTMNLWDTVLDGNSMNDRKIAQAVLWGNLEGSNKFVADEIDGISKSELKSKQDKLNEAITNYDKKPSFNGNTIKLKYGVTTEVKNTTKGVNLKDFDTQVGNTANVDVKVEQDKILLTPKDKTKANGTLAFKKSFNEGTPYIYRKQGQQALALGGIDDPNNFLLKMDIELTGDAKIVKTNLDGTTVPKTKFKVDFEGENAPKSETITTGDDGSYTFKDIHDGVKVTATEISVPSPYVLDSAKGNSDVVEGIIKVGETITLTKKNDVAKGQIIVDKSGIETDKTMWNQNYTLEGNIFEIREKTQDGKVIKEIKSNAEGVAETEKDLPLGTYWVTEKQASNGFVNTFKPVKVDITYKDQTVAVVIEKTEGKNQEVVGETTLVKEDSETKNETQGRATFKGAEYGLFYSTGEPVKWNDNFKPQLAIGDKANEENVVVRITDDSQQAQIKHLALNDYYWQETKAPEGYQKDLTKHVVKLTYKDQSTKVVTNNVTSKENVIKFNFGGFKYVTSKNGSAQSGYNGIKFNLTPIEPTKGETKSVETKTDKNGYDGAWDFENVPYGDYRFEEEKSPEGFKLIQPLIINSKYDEGNKKYTFTITEEGQNEPIKVVNVAEDEIHEGSNVVQLSKLFLYDDTIPEEEPPMIETLFVTKEGEQQIDPTKDQNLVDKVKNKVGKSKVGKELTYFTQFHKIDKDGKDSVVGEVTTTQKIEKEEFEFDVPFEYKADTIKDGEKLVATHIVYEDKEKTKEYTKHFDLENEKQTIIAEVPVKPEIETLFIVKDNTKDSKPSEKDKKENEAPKKETESTDKPVQIIDPTIDNSLSDIVKNKVGKDKVGKELTYFTQFHKIDKDGKDSVVGEVTTTKQIEKTEFEFDVPFEYKANTIKGGEKLVATHIVYEDKEKTKEYAKHFDLKNEKQTIVAEAPEQPEIETLFVAENGKQEIDPTKDQVLTDKVKNKIGKNMVDKELTYFTQFHKIDKDGKDSVVGEVTITKIPTVTEFTFDVPFEYKANTLKNGEKLVATHIVYEDKEKTKEYAKHFDLKNEKQTIVAKTPEQPKKEEPKKEEPKKDLPKTGQEVKNFAVVGSLILSTIGIYFLLRKKPV